MASLSLVASLYYEEGLGLSEIAKRLDRSVSRVSRMLQEAREAGIVEIRVRHPSNRKRMLEERLERTFGLRQAYVLSVDGAGSVHPTRSLGQLAADVLASVVGNGMAVGIGWGSHLLATVSAFRAMAPEPGVVVQVSGSVSSADPSTDGAQLAQLLANKLGFPVRTLPAPLVVSSEPAADELRRHPTVAEAMRTAAGVDVALIGVGTPRAPSGGLRRSGYLDDAEARTLIRAGAVGDICGFHLAADGRVLDVPFNRRIIGIEPDVLRRIPKVLIVAQGAEKVMPLRAAMAGNYVGALLTDEPTAAAILDAPTR